MPQELQPRLRHIRRRIRQVLWLHGVSWTVAVLFGATLLAGLLDWLLHLDDSGVRLILGLGILGGSAWVVWHRLLSPLTVDFSDIDLARLVERRFPNFSDGFSSTVEFIQRGLDPRLGSTELQRQTVDRTLAAIEQTNISDIIQPRSVVRITTIAVGVCLIVTLVVGFNPATAATALHRLVFPFSSAPWPKQTQLRFVDAELRPLLDQGGTPLRVARGATLELFVENVRGRIPRDAHLEYRLIGERPVAAPLREITLRDAKNRRHPVGQATIVAARGPIEFRAVGGDDREMPWRRLEVVPPPVLENLQVTLTPPAYLGRDVERLGEGVGHVQGYLGTRVDIRALASKPLRSASLRLKSSESFPATIGNDARELRASFVIDAAGVYSYWFALKDRQNFENTDAPRYEIRGIADTVPNVVIDEPATDLLATPTATVPIVVTAEDDIGLREIRLRYRRQRGEQNRESAVRRLYQPNEDGPTEQQVEDSWNLAELGLEPGMELAFHAEATDDFNLGGEHVGRSNTRTITIVSPSQKAAELAARQTALLDELERIYKDQARAREQVEELRIQFRDVGELRAQDFDLLQRVEIDQREISARLTAADEGVESRANALLEELQNNRIDDPESEGRLQRIAAEIAGLRAESLPAIEQELTQARKEAQREDRPSTGDEPIRPDKAAPKAPAENQSEERPQAGNDQDAPLSHNPDAVENRTEGQTPPSTEAADSLSRAGEHQEVVLNALTELRQLLAQWRSRRELTTELNELIAGQEKIAKETAEIGKETLTKALSELSPQQQSELAKLKDRQQREAERVEQFRQRLAKTADRLAQVEPAAGDSVSAAIEEFDRKAIAGRMRETAEDIQRNNVGQAAREQQRILDELNEVGRILRNEPSTDTEMLVEQMKEAESELEQLRQREETLLKQLEAASQIADSKERELELQRLVKEQRQLRREAEAMARRLERLQAEHAGESARRASARMEQAERALERNDAGDAARQQQEALSDLEQSQRELAQARRQAEERLAFEQLEKIADRLKGMIPRQQAVIEETRRLDSEYQKRTRWSRVLLRSLRDLAEVEAGLQQETERLSQELEAAEVFALALRGAAKEMQRAAALLSKRQTDAETIAAEQAALARFQDLVTALEPDKKDPPANQNPPQAGEEQPPAEGPPMDGIPQLAQLKVLKSLQEHINQATAELDEIRRRTGRLSEAEQQRLQDLAREQSEIADLARNLMHAVRAPFETEEREDRQLELE